MVNIWFSINLGNPMLAEESLEKIKTLFLSKYEHAKKPKETAVFFRHESNGGVHCVIKVYFSPAAFMLAEEVGAIACKKPCLDGLGLLAGSNESLIWLFSEAN